MATFPGLGLGTCIGLAEETTWGTAVSRTNWLRVVSTSLQKKPELVPIAHLGTKGAASTNRREHFIRSEKSGGDIEVYMAYDDSTNLLLKHAFGAVAEAGAGPYTHTYTLAMPGTNGLTVEQVNGTTTKAEVFEGSIITSFELKFAANEVAKLMLPGIICQTSGGLVAAGTPTYSSTQEYILHHHAGQFGFNSNNYDIVSASVKVERKFAERAYLGGKETLQPVAPDFMSVTASVELEWVDTNFDAEFLASTQGDATLSFVGTGNNAMDLTLQNAVITDVSRPVSSSGVIRQTVSFMMFSDGTDEGLKLVMTNDNATALIN